MNQVLRLEMIRDANTQDILYWARRTQLASIVEVSEGSITIAAPMKAGAGLLVGLRGELYMDNKVTPFDVIGRIKNIGACDGTSSRFEIELRQYDKTLWGRLLELLAKKQKRADQLLKWIRGDGE